MIVKGSTETVILMLMSRINVPMSVNDISKLVYYLKIKDYKSYAHCHNVVKKTIYQLLDKYLVEIADPKVKRGRKYIVSDLGRGSYLCDVIEIHLVRSSGLAEGVVSKIYLEGSHPGLAKEGKLTHIV